MNQITIDIRGRKDFYEIHYYPRSNYNKSYFVDKEDLVEMVSNVVKNALQQKHPLDFKLKSTRITRLSSSELSELREYLEDRFPGTTFNLTPSTLGKLESYI